MAQDNVLISRTQSGDEAAFAELMRAYYPYVYTIVIGIVNNPHDAEEVVQDAFLNAYRGLAQLEDTAKFKSWLAEIARNSARDRLRKQRIDTIPIDEVSEHTLQTPDAVDDQLIRDEQRELIRRAMETLSKKDREIARSYYLDGASYDELIQTHGLSYKAISLRLSCAKQRLAKRLQYLLTGLSVPPVTTLKQIYSGGLTLMKIGTTLKITVTAIAIVALIFIGIGVHQIVLPKFSASKDTSSSVQTPITTSTPTTLTPKERAQTDANQETENRENQRTISAEERQQIENFFSQFEETEAQSEADTPQPPTESESEIEPASTDTDAASEPTEQSAEDVMNAFIEAYKNFDVEAMLPLVTGVAKEELDNGREEMVQSLQDPELQVMIQSIFSGIEIVGSEYVGEEFHFRLRIPMPEMPTLPEMPDIEIPELPESIEVVVKMQKVDGAWRIYDTGSK